MNIAKKVLESGYKQAIKKCKNKKEKEYLSLCLEHSDELIKFMQTNFRKPTKEEIFNIIGYKDD